MKKFLLMCCMAFGAAFATNAQTTTATSTDATVNASTKSCCASMAEAVEKNCVEAYSTSQSVADASKSETAPAGEAAATAPKAPSCCAAKAAQTGSQACPGKAMAERKTQEAEKEIP